MKKYNVSSYDKRHQTYSHENLIFDHRKVIRYLDFDTVAPLTLKNQHINVLVC